MYFMALAIIIAGISAFTVLEKHKRTPFSNTFMISSPTDDPYDPNNYSPNSNPLCNGSIHVRYITTSEVYPSNHPDYPDKPKVDEVGAGTINARITTTLNNSSLCGVSDLNGNTVYLQP